MTEVVGCWGFDRTFLHQHNQIMRLKYINHSHFLHYEKTWGSKQGILDKKKQFGFISTYKNFFHLFGKSYLTTFVGFDMVSESEMMR